MNYRDSSHNFMRYPLNAYLRNQKDVDDPATLNADGLLLHPVVISMVVKGLLGLSGSFCTIDLEQKTYSNSLLPWLIIMIETYSLNTYSTPNALNAASTGSE